MAYQLYDVQGNTIARHDLQDKGVWCEMGAAKEDVFVRLYGARLGLIINPEKENNPFAPDLYNTVKQVRGDLKEQGTPFFQAGVRFGLDPQLTVVFNVKDKIRYEQLYPELEIYFWVDWQVVRFSNGNKDIKVQPLTGVWHIPFLALAKLTESAPVHHYGQRIGDTMGNAKSSYVLHLGNPAFTRIA